MTDDELAKITRALRLHFAEHNLRVALLSLLTLVASLALWFLLRATARWLSLLTISAVQGTDARLPRSLDSIFLFAAATSLFVAWVDRRMTTDDRARDHKSAAEIVWEILLAIPRSTLAIGATLSAWQHLSRLELTTAATLVARLRAHRRMPLHTLPLEIPEEALREKILFALQLVQVVEVRREDREFWISLNPLRPASLLPTGPQERARL